ncbi:MAG: hypothetical protein JWQ38_2107 [Flavipsychrobacter sp.]|nr:hypothetical protein [Flavipsychrobacter sp.]
MKRNFYKLITAACLLLLSSGAGAQLITTVVGTGVAGTSSAGGPATMQQLLGPVGVSYDYTSQKLYIADSGANLVRMVDVTTGSISVFAGGGTTGVGDGKAATLAQLVMPTGVSADGMGNVFIADLGQHRIRKVDASGIITTVAGTGFYPGPYGDAGFATAATLNEPYNVKANSSGLLYITDRGDNVVRLVNGLGVISTIAGIQGTNKYLADGGPATAAEFNTPVGVAIDFASGAMFVSDRGNNVIRKITAAGIISTVAGNNYPGYKGDFPLVSTPATNAQLKNPSGIAYKAGSPGGNVYVCDAGNNVIRRFDEFNQRMVLVAGDPTPVTGMGFADGTPGKFNNPMGVCIASTGDLYIADKGNNRIRKVTTFGVVSTVAGNGAPAYTGDGVPGGAMTASFNGPQGVALNAAGTKLYIADAGNDVIRVLDLATNTVDLVAGTPLSGVIDNGDGGAALAAAIPNPTNLVLDAAGNIYVTSTGYSTPPKCGNRVRIIEASTGKIFTYYGNINRNFYGGENVIDTGVSCGFAQPEGLIFNSTGDLLVAATNDNRIEWRINSAHPGLTLSRSYTFAGNGTKGYGGLGAYELLDRPTGATNSGSNTYIADRMNSVIRKIDSRGVMSTMVGIPDSDGYLAPPFLGSDTRYDTMSYPCAVTAIAGTSPALYIADAGNAVIRKVDLSVSPYTETRYAGQVGIHAYLNAAQATNANFKGISGIDIDPSTGDIYVCERGNNSVRKIAGTGLHAVTTVAGTPPIGGLLGSGGPATAAQMNNPYSVVTDTFGNLYVADRGNNIIRKINKFGIISTYAGTGTAGYSGDGGPADKAQLSGPSGISIVTLPPGQVIMYVADQGNNRIRRIDGAGNITTFAGVTAVGNTDGTVAVAKFYYPTSVVVNSTDTKVYVADGNNRKVRMITGGNVTTIVNSAGTPGYTDGVSATTATAGDPKALALDKTDNWLYIADFSNNAVRRVNLAITTPTIVTVAGQGPTIGGFTGDGVAATATALQSPAGVWVDATNNLFISDFGNERVRRVDPTSGIIQTVAGNGVPGYSGDGGAAIKAQLYDNFGICVDTSGALFIADRTNNVVRKVTPVLIDSFTESTTTTCQDSCVTFISLSIGTIDTKTWSVSPAGPTISAPNSDTTTICFPANGTFAVTFTITSGTKTATKTVNVDVSATPHPPISRSGHWDLSVPGTGYGHYQWYSGTTLIPGAVINTFTAPALGVYSVEVDSNGCNGVSTYTVVSTTSITKANSTEKNKYWLSQQGQDNSSVMVYSARPVDAPLTVTMYDATGRTILDDKWSLGTSNIQIKAASLAPGIYLIKLTNNNTSEVLKWLKN